jgi:hypothetical protein
VIEDGGVASDDWAGDGWLSGNHASCRVADKAGFRLSGTLPPLPPEFLNDAHLHTRAP